MYIQSDIIPDTVQEEILLRLIEMNEGNLRGGVCKCTSNKEFLNVYKADLEEKLIDEGFEDGKVGGFYNLYKRIAKDLDLLGKRFKVININLEA